MGSCMPEGGCDEQLCDADELACDGTCVDIASQDHCGECARSCAFSSECIASADGYACVARDCAGVRSQLLANEQPVEDGLHRIDPDAEGPAPVLEVYCADLETDAPKAYISVDSARNYSTHKFIYADHADGCGPCDRPVAHWERLRLVIDTSGVLPIFHIASNDTRFSWREGFNRAHELSDACAEPEDGPCGTPSIGWARIHSCNRTNPRAEGLYNLEGTGFRFPADTLDLVRASGWRPERLQATLDEQRHELLLRFEATCGNYGILNDEGENLGLVWVELEPAGP